jgi:hypothetical protein
MTRTLDRFRTALKFSLWTWALYWPGGGLLLLYGGLDAVSLLVTFGSLTCFILLLATGALKADSSRTLKEFVIERPLYLVGALVFAIVAAAAIPSLEAVALLLFATVWFGGLVFSTVRLVEHVRASGGGIFRMKADQVFIVFAITAYVSALVFLDALVPLLANGATLGSPAVVVAVSTWMNLLYPVLFWNRRHQAPEAKTRIKPAKQPRPFRAS